MWPPLSERFGLHPRDWRLPPEEGGLTYGQWQAYLDAVGEPTKYPVPVWLVKPPGRR